MMDHLILAHVQEQLPARIVALGICVEPARERQTEIDESAKRANGPLRRNHDLSRRVRPENSAAGSRKRAAVESAERSLDVRQPARVGGESIDLTSEEEAQVATPIRARHQREPPR